MPKKATTRTTARSTRSTAKVALVVNRSDKRRPVRPEDVLAATNDLLATLEGDPAALATITDRITAEAATQLAEARGKLTTREMALDVERAARKKLEAENAKLKEELRAARSDNAGSHLATLATAADSSDDDLDDEIADDVTAAAAGAVPSASTTGSDSDSHTRVVSGRQRGGSRPAHHLSCDEYIAQHVAAEAKKHRTKAQAKAALRTRHAERCRTAFEKGRDVADCNCIAYRLGVQETEVAAETQDAAA